MSTSPQQIMTSLPLFSFIQNSPQSIRDFTFDNPERFSVSDQGALTLNSAKVTDSGVYTCRAANQFGVSVATATLEVKGHWGRLTFVEFLSELIVLSSELYFGLFRFLFFIFLFFYFLTIFFHIRSFIVHSSVITDVYDYDDDGDDDDDDDVYCCVMSAGAMMMMMMTTTTTTTVSSFVNKLSP